ncbi:hypothetical protein NPIL_337741 [Nephila pilipes]|uniref:Uncharacterized protein n=1 Tax=Nephila pilipes TaxID=299642 RepID=A0A8X6U8D0_NEPPI|nr:hypothetical protein NPIL_337741 [Nephila pilipes]
MTAKKKKTDETICSNKFKFFSIEDPPESIQMDDSPLPLAHMQQPPAKNPKKKTGNLILNSWTFQRHCEQYKSFSRYLHYHSVYPRVNCGTKDIQLHPSL